MNKTYQYSIYIHLPFCLSKCSYCDFYSIEAREIPFEEYARCLLKEWETRRNLVEDGDLVSVFAGGGTPSLWPGGYLSKLFEEFPLGDDIEVTLEVNPGDASSDWFEQLVNAGVNRFSIGGQSLDDKRLKWLGRRHDSNAVKVAVAAAKSAGAKSVGVDLIYGTPDQNESMIGSELDNLVDLGVDHVSAYELTVSEGTSLARWVAKGEVVLPGNDEMADLWQVVGDKLGNQGFERYEISNYAKPGHRCKHNVHYWRGGIYVGLGAGAHGFVQGGDGKLSRYSNANSVDEYLGSVSHIQLDTAHQGIGSSSVFETLNSLTHAREKIMLGLRTTDGVSLGEICLDLTADVQSKWKKLVKKAELEGLVQVDGDCVKPTEKGMLQADTLAGRFF